MQTRIDIDDALSRTIIREIGEVAMMSRERRANPEPQRACMAAPTG
jgi:hypothetical protein